MCMATKEDAPLLCGIEDPRIQFVYTSNYTHYNYKSTDVGVPPAEIDHGLNLSDHNCGHLVQWKCDVPTAVDTIDRRSTAVYSCAPTSIQLYTPAFNVVTFYFTETFPHCNLPIRRERFSTGLVQPAVACWCIGSMWGPGSWLGSGSSSASFARYLNDSLSLLVSLVYLNLVRIRLLQYLSTKEILP